MSYAESLTQTYTIADIGKVIDCFAADLDMTSQSTGLLTRELVKGYAADVKAMAQRGYLLEANIVLKDASGNVIRAAKYEVNTDAASPYSTSFAQRSASASLSKRVTETTGPKTSFCTISSDCSAPTTTLGL